MSEIHDIVGVEVTGEYSLRVTFDEGARAAASQRSASARSAA
jgi:hypothetical protein